MFICYLTSVFVMFIAGTTDATGAAATGQGAPIAGGVRFGLSQAANLDNSWTFEGHENEHDPQVDTRAPLASRRSLVAERAGFEPAVPVARDTAFPVPHNRPLCHLSGAANSGIHPVSVQSHWVGCESVAARRCCRGGSSGSCGTDDDE